MTNPRKLKDGGNQERQDRAQKLLLVARNFKPTTNIRYRQRAQAELLEMLRPLIFKLIQNTNWLQYICEDDLAQHARQVILTIVIPQYDGSQSFVRYAARVIQCRLIDYIRSTLRKTKGSTQLQHEPLATGNPVETPEGKEELEDFYFYLIRRISPLAQDVLKAQRENEPPNETCARLEISRARYRILTEEIISTGKELAEQIGVNPLVQNHGE